MGGYTQINNECRTFMCVREPTIKHTQTCLCTPISTQGTGRPVLCHGRRAPRPRPGGRVAARCRGGAGSPRWLASSSSASPCSWRTSCTSAPPPTRPPSRLQPRRPRAHPGADLPRPPPPRRARLWGSLAGRGPPPVAPTPRSLRWAWWPCCPRCGVLPKQPWPAPKPFSAAPVRKKGVSDIGPPPSPMTPFATPLILTTFI